MLINEQRLLQTFCELVRIASPSCYEAAVASYCQQVLQEQRWQVSIDDSAVITGSDTGNLIATLPASDAAFGFSVEAFGGFKELFFSAHMDTVVPAEGIKPVVKDGIIRSVGDTILGGDDKAGIAALLELAYVLADNPNIKHPQITLIFSVQEEIGLNGAKALDAQTVMRMKGQPCFVLDAGGKPGTIVNGAPYQLSFFAKIIGKAAHAGIAPEQGISAIECASSAIARMRLGRLDNQTTANVGTISGGMANNIVAEECVLTGECRSHEEARAEMVKQQLHDSIIASGKDFAAETIVKWEENYKGFFMPNDHPVLEYCLSKAKLIGLKTFVEVSGGGADTNIYAANGACALSLGTGMSKIHTTDEELAVSDLNDLARYCLALATYDLGH
jgi:tripeptide aminopeptidase